MEDFDFGFSAVSEDELETVEASKKFAAQSEATVDELKDRLDRMFRAILPLLNNLRKDPEKQYIVWPDREAKIDAFETKLAAILDGDDK